MVNADGKLFSVAELLAYGYATFNSDQSRMPRYYKIEQYTRPGARSYKFPL